MSNTNERPEWANNYDGNARIPWTDYDKRRNRRDNINWWTRFVAVAAAAVFWAVVFAQNLPPVQVSQVVTVPEAAAAAAPQVVAGPAGPRGPRGFQGAAVVGLPGEDGRDGVDGRHGVDGKDGAAGARGRSGKDGRDGVDGKDGAAGAAGAAGVDGKDGRDGIDGKDGKDGRDGIDGKDGAAGPQGPQGEPGPPGPQGPAGETPDLPNTGGGGGDSCASDPPGVPCASGTYSATASFLPNDLAVTYEFGCAPGSNDPTVPWFSTYDYPAGTRGVGEGGVWRGVVIFDSTAPGVGTSFEEFTRPDLPAMRGYRVTWERSTSGTFAPAGGVEVRCTYYRNGL